MKRAWLANVPGVVAWLEMERLAVSPRTAEGVYRNVLAQTGDQEIASIARAKVLQREQLSEAEAASQRAAPPTKVPLSPAVAKAMAASR